MFVVIRVDASIQIGTGHVMRCLTLADQLTEVGYFCVFLCREHEGNLGEHIATRGYKVLWLTGLSGKRSVDGNWNAHAAWLGESWEADAEQTVSALTGYDVDWLIVDHYALDSRWERRLSNSVDRIMVIDDLADRPHCCDLLLDQTYLRTSDEYNDLVGVGCKLLCGSQYTLLRPEFTRWRSQSLAKRAQASVGSILINMGGVDKENVTEKVLGAMEGSQLPDSTELTVVMGGHSPSLASVRHAATLNRFRVAVQTDVDNMAELMTSCELAIGAAGATSWERCCLGLPTILIVIADNQTGVANVLRDNGAAYAVNSVKNIDHELPEILDSLVNDIDALMSVSKSASKVVDGKGARRVVLELMRSA